MTSGTRPRDARQETNAKKAAGEENPEAADYRADVKKVLENRLFGNLKKRKASRVFQCSGATASGTGRATEAMVGSENG